MLVDDPDATVLHFTSRNTHLDVVGARITGLDASYHTMKLALRGLVSMTENLPWPLKAAPQTALNVIKLVEDLRTVNPKANNLLLAISELAEVLAEYRGKHSDDEQMLPHIRRFLNHLQIIAIRLRICRATATSKKLATAFRLQAVIAEEAANLTQARELMMTVIAAGTHSRLRDIKQLLLASPALAPQAVLVGLELSTTPPPMPHVFCGRGVQLEAMIQIIIAANAVRLAIVGAGGIGKTSLALALLHDDRVRSLCEDRRIFVSCEAAVDVDAILVTLTRMLSLPLYGDLLKAIINYFRSQPHSILVLDNLETIWLSRDSAVGVKTEQLLAHLASIDELVLVVTTRGTLLPNSVRWSNHQSATLGILELEAARQTFGQIVGRESFEPTELEALDHLMRNVDCMPLAVNLLARLHESPVNLLRQWEKQRTSLLQVDSHNSQRRDLSVEVSIQVSLDYLPDMNVDPEPFQLLAICSFLPDGLFPESCEQLRPTFSRLDRAIRLLRHHALVYVGSSGELRMLNPIRLFVQSHFPVTAKHFSKLRKRYYAVAAAAPQEPAEDFTARSAQVAPEYGNLKSFLMYLVEREGPSPGLVEAVRAATEYSFWTSPSDTLSEGLLGRVADHPAWLAQCLFSLARLDSRKSLYKVSNDRFRAAQDIYTQLGDRSSVAWCKRWIAGNLLQMAKLDEAEQLLLDAKQTFTDLQDGFGAAACELCIGSTYCDRGEFRKALDHFIIARDMPRSSGRRDFTAQCMHNLGRAYLALEDISKAKIQAEAALAEYSSISARQGVESVTHMLGHCHRLQSDFDTAERLFTSLMQMAIPGDRAALANRARDFGVLRGDQGRLEEAVEHLKRAVQLFEAIGAPHWTNICRKELREMEERLSKGGEESSAT
ncbi:hypothetical protein BKA62DRAFT_295516 [Auriculariales sp. MPI-PUGE-AT-0066]|nr:hypothetical protein BKA62DRAFT_295516 [Auriculariales sp. MPI-PUGE-AT-0066]